MLEPIQYMNIKRCKKYKTFDLNTRSKLYYDNDLIHKIPLTNSSNLKIILEKIDELKLSELVEIKKVIYKKEVLVGYSIKNYKEYKSLEILKNRHFELKKNDCLKIVQTLDVLLKNNMAYTDFHLGNFLINPVNNNIKICDLDSFVLINGKKEFKNCLKSLLTFILAYIYEVEYCDIRNVLDAGMNGQNLFISKCFFYDNPISIEKINYIINLIEQADILNEKKLIIERSKELSELGYKKYLRY